MRLPIQLRSKRDDDRGFIYKNWLRSYRDSEGWVSNTVYYWHQHRIIDRLWNDPGVVWLVAVSQADPTHIYGFLCGEQTDAGFVVHYVYVRQVFRRKGVATALVCALQGQLDPGQAESLDTFSATHLTVAARNIMRGKYANLMIYNPYHKFYNLQDGWQYAD